MDREPQNCWEFQNCPKGGRDSCPAYKLNLGRRCWEAASIASGSRAEDLSGVEHCRECLWFKKLNLDLFK